MNPVVDHLQVIRGGLPAITFARGDHAELADKLLDALSPKREHLVHDEGTLWTYAPERGSWDRVRRDDMLRIVKSFAGAPRGDRPLKVTASAAEGAAIFAGAEVHREGYFAGASVGVAFTNGFAGIEEGRVIVRPNSQDHRARHGFGFDYQPVATHPLLDEFFDQIFGDVSEDERAGRAALLQEFFGACLAGLATSYQRCLVLVGTGGNGKSQAAEIGRALFGSSNVVSLAPQQWGERFMLSRLVGVLANFVDEMPEREIVGGDAFKGVISGEPVHSERKHQAPFDFRPRAGHVFNANSLPSTADHSEGFWRRIMVCPFTRNMTKAECYRTEAARAVIDAELPAIAAWALEGAARVQLNRGYTVSSGSADALAEWRRTSDSVALYIDEKTRAVDVSAYPPDEGTKASALYASYRSWAIDNGYKPVSAKEFARRMAGIGKGAVHQNDGNHYPVKLVGNVSS